MVGCLDEYLGMKLNSRKHMVRTTLLMLLSAEVLNLLQKFCKDDIYKPISRPVLSCYARQYPELQIHQTVWFKESKGSHNNCVVFSKHVRK